MSSSADGVTGTSSHAQSTAALSLAALGIIYGDIGTSPLYTIRECFVGAHGLAPNPEDIMGIMSMVFWSLIMVVSIKYVTFMLKADNKGEGGTFPLLAALGSSLRGRQRLWKVLTILTVSGASLLYGDGVITPAISVLSAIEGLNMATNAATPFVVPLTIVILIALFVVQRHGTGTIGKVFGPIMIVWFLTIGLLGLRSIIAQPAILAALNPVYMIRFFSLNHLHGIVALASVVLCITGCEALYADMGHFGRHPIRLTWHGIVLPCLLLSYAGQCALLLQDPTTAEVNPFYALVPKHLLYPLVALATISTIIASQAMISGVYSLTQQAVQLGFVPRMHIIHTSARTKGQIYMPSVNWLLMAACLVLVLIFRESTRLADAYGFAVTGTMTITTIMYFHVTRFKWHWPPWQSVSLLVLFLFFDCSFLGANILKVFDGGWIMICIATIIAVSMTTWRDGRALLAKHYSLMRLPTDVFLRDLRELGPSRTEGTAVFMTISPEGVPHTLIHHLKHTNALHERVLLLSILSAEKPSLNHEERVEFEAMGQGFYRVKAHYGFMETPNMEEILELLHRQGLPVDIYSTSFFLGRETLFTTGNSSMAQWRKALFVYMSRNSWNATSYFGLPIDRVVEIGNQVQI